MAPIPRKRSLADMQQAGDTIPPEFDDTQYFREVLQLEDCDTETLLEQSLAKQADQMGITISRPSTALKNFHDSICDSAITVASRHARTASTGSDGSSSTGMTSRSSNEQLDSTTPPPARRSPISRRSFSFSEYEKYLMDLEAQESANPSFLPPVVPAEPTPSLFSVSTKRSFFSLKNRVKNGFPLRHNKASQVDLISCICCRDDFEKNKALQILPCSHNYCDSCLRILIIQASTDESKMPPRCCSKPVSGTIIQRLLSVEEQHVFLTSVLQFSTPWEARIFCPNHACGEFIPEREKIDPKHPFEVVCRKCRTRACSTCKRAAHAFGRDCPADWELDAVLQMGKNAGWRRCYKCRTLVELTQGCSHITCRCKAQFCYICGAVWDPVVGCPNYCNGEEELERRRVEEVARAAELEAERIAREEAEEAEAIERYKAEKRTLESDELNALRARLINERDRFAAFERKMKWVMWTRHGQAKIDILDRYDDLQIKMKERHNKTATHLEDRQVCAEMELRASQKQSERSIQVRLKHMEAYCSGLGKSPSGNNPARVVTERDLRELGQQYNIRDDLERLHQSKVNVMREKQAMQMENLVSRQEEELEKLAAKQEEELETMEESFITEETAFISLFSSRKERLTRRWPLVEELERKKLERITGLRFAAMAPIEWPGVRTRQEEGLEVVTE